MANTINLQEAVAKLTNVSPQTKTCLSCHISVTPGIVADWLKSRMAHITPAQAWQKPPLARQISTPLNEIPSNLRNVVVGCYECHALNPDKHPDTISHFGFQIHPIVTPNDCAVCHKVEVQEYSESSKAWAYDNLMRNPLYKGLVDASTTFGCMGQTYGGERTSQAASCLMCHGTVVKVQDTVDTIVNGMPVTLVKYEGYPNHGVGRVNPDGSRGACTACHPRHSFSIEIARSPYTCGQCHLDPDVPAYNVWKESKHGNIWMVLHKHFNMKAPVWKPGADFTAPTCATCHMSQLVNPVTGEVIAKRTHNVDTRLWVRLFGLIYAHPTPVTGKHFELSVEVMPASTAEFLANEKGLTIAKALVGVKLPLPISLAPDIKTGQFVYATLPDGSPGLISPEEQQRRKEQMMKICMACHNKQYVENQFALLDSQIQESNMATLKATVLLLKARQSGLASVDLQDPKTLFDEYFERLWVESWLFYANSIRYGAAMNGQDWTTFKRGWYQLTRNIGHMELLLKLWDTAKAAAG
jgi:nitrate/TMAO reductase-like tetraheme cytochrome c subunit